MHFLKRKPNLIKFTCLTAVASGAGWLYYQVKRTQDILNNTLDTSILWIAKDQASKEREKDNYIVIPIQDHLEIQSNPFDKKWNTLKFALAKRLLSLANNENMFIRTKAVRQLARIKTLDSWHFAMLSNMIDARTAVGLARTLNADPRLFKEPPLRYLNYSRDMIVDAMKQLLITLHARSQHPCMGYFVSEVFVDVHDVGRLVDYDSAPIELIKFIHSQSGLDILPMCLESLLHHASIGKYAKDIAELNGLLLLMEIYNRFKDDIETTAKICRIISYVSFNHDLLDDLFKSGWVTVLAEWMKHDDVRISIPAAKALANLDIDEDSSYYQRLYPLHPITRTTKKPEVDVIFVHGLLGGVFFTWRQRDQCQETLGLIGKKKRKESITPADTCVMNPIKSPKKKPITDPLVKEFIEDMEEHLEGDCGCNTFEVVWEDIPTNCNFLAKGPYSCPEQKYRHCFHEDCYTYCWPRDWLAEDCHGLRIIGVNYETNLSMWAPICPTEKLKTLEERCDELIGQLRRAGVGKRPIVWVTHSMGGLMVKNLLCKVFESENQDVRNICAKTKGIVFYSTPHSGSSIAKLNQASSLLLLPSIEVQELKENSLKLLEIHQHFLNIIKEVPMKIVSFVETNPTVVTAMKFKFLVVEPHSGNPGIGEYYEIPQDHLGICKPASRDSFLYQKVLHLIEDVLSENKKI